MRTPRPLPPDLASRPFSRREAADADVPLGRLRRSGVVRPFHGVQTERPPVTLVEHCAAYAVRMRRGDVFSHVTAARLHGLPLPGRLEALTALDVAATHPAAAPATRGVVGHRLRSAPPTVLVEGLPVCGPVEVWCQLAGLLDVEDLVAIADRLLGDGRTPGRATREELEAAIDAPGRYRTAPLRRALGLARIGSRSPQESRLRVLLVLGGAPEPAVNAPITTRSGRVLGHGDLVWPERRVVGEYEGEQHRTDREQWTYDVRRYEQFREEGWTVVRVVAADLARTSRAALIGRFLRALGLEG